MQIKVLSSRLQDGLKNVAGVANARRTPAILGNVLLDAKDGRVKLVASDLNITLVTSVECDVVEPGATTVPARIFQNVLSALPVGEIEIIVDGKDKMKVVFGESSFRIGGISAKEFPRVTKVGDESEFSMSAKDLKAAVRKTAYAQSNDDTRITLKGMLFDFAGDQLKTVATDGRRLAVTLVKAEWKCADTKFNVPKDAVKEVQRLLDDDGLVRIRYSNGMAVFDIEKSGTTVYCKTTEEAYPNYSAVIPQAIIGEAVVDRSRMCDMLNRAKVMALDGTPSVLLTFDNGSVDSKVSGMDDGEGRDKFAIKYEGDKISFAFNPYYMYEAMSVLNSDDVKIEFSGIGRPILIKGDGESGLAVLMPLRQM